MKTCKHCNKQFYSSHYCDRANRTIDFDDASNFLFSAALGAVTDNAILGGLLGGDMVGGLVGDLLADGDLF